MKKIFLSSALLVGALFITSDVLADSKPNDRYITLNKAWKELSSCSSTYMSLLDKYLPNGGLKMMGAKGESTEKPQDPFKAHPDLLKARNETNACIGPVLEWLFYYGWSKYKQLPGFDPDHKEIYYPSQTYSYYVNALMTAPSWPKDQADAREAQEYCKSQPLTFLVRTECYQPLAEWNLEKTKASQANSTAQKAYWSNAVALSKLMHQSFLSTLATVKKLPQNKGNTKQRLYKFSRYSEMIEWLHAVETGAKSFANIDIGDTHMLIQTMMEESLETAPDDLSVTDTLMNLIDVKISNYENANPNQENVMFSNLKTILTLFSRYKSYVSEPFELNDRILPQLKVYVKSSPFPSEQEKRNFLKIYRGLVDTQAKIFPARILKIEKLAKAYDVRAGLMSGPNTLNSDKLDGAQEYWMKNKDPKYIKWVLASLTQRVHQFDIDKIAVEYYSQTDSSGKLVFMGKPHLTDQEVKAILKKNPSAQPRVNLYQSKYSMTGAKYITSSLSDKERKELNVQHAIPNSIVIHDFKELSAWAKKSADEVARRSIRQ